MVVMTVNPGFGHLHSLPGTPPKIWRIRQMIDRLHIRCEIEVDGGIDEKTASLAATAGADVFVARSSIFGASDGITAAMGRLRAAIPPYTAQEIEDEIGESEEWDDASHRRELSRAGRP